MPRRCTVCGHAQRTEIDRALVQGATLRNIAERYGLSLAAVNRHLKQHVPRLLTDAAGAKERLTAAALLSDLKELQQTARRIGRKAEKTGDLPTALRAVAELRGLLAVGLRGVETAELEERLDALETLLPTDTRKRIA